MSANKDARQFASQAEENQLHISVDDAAALDSFVAAVDAAYSTIREIDTADFEPATIFVPTPSGGPAALGRKNNPRMSD
jgi:hypothetical protein